MVYFWQIFVWDLYNDRLLVQELPKSWKSLNSFDNGVTWALFYINPSRLEVQRVKEQEKFTTQPSFFLTSSPLLTISGETKLRQQASGETITGPLLFQSWGHPSAQRSRNKGHGFIAGSTVWKETHSNIVWFSEIVDRHPCCFLWTPHSHITTIKQVSLHLRREAFVLMCSCIFSSFFFFF